MKLRVNIHVLLAISAILLTENVMGYETVSMELMSRAV